ncbi:outer membrane protein assembly factor BamB family protein [Halorussus marinus]|uniref:outer membrane protein assembly factor BamB family protein n=1 Tax=Halorussus marinus TaxID=2505976 RepID=UPI00106EB35A|nr:PQQ-binding-like beta-propeller repeat protein [Halorussus marinus]
MPSRRRFLATCSAAAVSGLAGCTGLLDDPPEGTVWSASVGGASPLSPPALTGRVVAAAGPDGDLEDGRVDAFDAASGERRWSKEVGRVTGVEAAGGVVYVGVKAGGDSARVLAFDARSGERRWNGSVRNLASAMAAADGALYAANGGLAAIDPADGSVRWQFDDRDGATFTIVVAPGEQLAADGRRVVYGGNGGIVALAPADGSVEWRADTDFSTNAGPALGDGTAYVGGDNGDGLAALDATSGDVRWTRTFGQSAGVAGIRPTDRSMLVATGTAGVGGSFGTLYELDPETGVERRETRFDAPVRGTATGGDWFVVRTAEDTVACFDAETFTEAWRTELSASALLATDGERAYAQTTDGTLWALAP